MRESCRGKCNGDEEYAFVHLHWCSSLGVGAGSSSESEWITSFAQVRMRSLSSSLWPFRLRGGEPDVAVIDDVPDTSEVDS